MVFGLGKMLFGPKNKGPMESRTAVYVHKDRPFVDTAQNLGMKTEFDFMSKPWTVTYTGTPTQWTNFLTAQPNALLRTSMNSGPVVTAGPGSQRAGTRRSRRPLQRNRSRRRR